VTRIVGYLKQNAIALAALFIALGGTSYAAVAIPGNSVGSSQLRKGAVTSNKIHSGAITAGKLSSKSFGGRILYFASITSTGFVTSSSPNGIKTSNWTLGSGGLVVFPHKLPRGCFPMVSAATPGTGGQTTVSATPNDSTQVGVETSAPTAVVLAVICAR
jgi:hypothetical protein